MFHKFCQNRGYLSPVPRRVSGIQKVLNKCWWNKQVSDESERLLKSSWSRYNPDQVLKTRWDWDP